MTSSNMTISKKGDWELDFYSRPILEADGKKRWELLITTSQELSGSKPFRWSKNCPAAEVNSIWLAEALKEALEDANSEGWAVPQKLRCWRSSMKTMVKRAAETLDLEVIASRRTYSLLEWLAEREKEVYPKEEGYLSGPLAPPAKQMLAEPIPLPEAIRGDAWSFASIPIGMLKEAEEWPMEFNGLLPIKPTENEQIPIPGLRLFSKQRALALAGWLGGLEPVKLVIEGTKLILEAGQEDRWLVTDLTSKLAQSAHKELLFSRENAHGLQFISVQATPNEERFTGFWMLRDISE